MFERNTIFALSSGRPPAGLGIIRVSGPEVRNAALALIGKLPPARHATLVAVHNEVGDLLDRAIILFFPAPASATGEDCLEFHCHGGRAVLDAVQKALSEVDGLRPALAGEFTRRAFENGRIDLNEAEGLADLLTAETESQRRAAMAMAEGGLSALVAAWQVALLQLSAMIEAVLDFSDEDDVPDAGIENDIFARLKALSDEVAKELTRPRAERLKDGIRVVLAGPPNAGKSTLINALAGRDAAIVSEIAGTTRDRIEVPCALNGIAYLLIDTAGLREGGADAIEQIGIARAREAMDMADIILWLGSPDDCPPNAISIASKADLGSVVDPRSIRLSVLLGEGLDDVMEAMDRRARALLPEEGAYAINVRQRAILSDLSAELNAARAESDMLLVAEHLRLGRLTMDRLTGRAGTEDMLDALFGTFCIGK